MVLSKGAFTIVSLALAATAVAETYPVKVERGVRARMRDGVQLVADVYRPDAEGRFATLLQRTPYDRKGGASQAEDLAAAGYVVVLQDTRGRFDSEGEFYPFRNESDDGFDSVAWVAALPYSNGRVGMFGGSYVGATQMLAAAARPPQLAAIFPYITASEYYEGWTYQGGALMRWFASSWTSGLTIDTLRRKAAQKQKPREWVEREPIVACTLFEIPTAAEVAPYFEDWVTHESDDDYWRRVRVSDYYDQMSVKALHAGGWHDIFSTGSIRNYLGLREKAKTPEARAGQRLLMGPWAHAATSPEGKIGDVVFGKDVAIDMTAAIRDWFDYALRGVANDYATKPPVRLFVMGENAWRNESEFPPARAVETRYYLEPVAAGKGEAPSRKDGLLATKPGGRWPSSRFEYDPADPVPTLGGRLCCGAALQPGPADQQPNESRPDVLIFSTPALTRDTEVTGFVALDLFAATSAVDTDFTAMLVDVEPSGFARYLADGIVRARYRISTARAEPVVPGQAYPYRIELGATSNVFKAGHRIRLYVSSSNFPRFDRNDNTGEPSATAARMLKATQTIFHDRTRPSALVLPIVPR
jgi:putative CocE/NonD family hydrolase